MSGRTLLLNIARAAAGHGTSPDSRTRRSNTLLRLSRTAALTSAAKGVDA